MVDGVRRRISFRDAMQHGLPPAIAAARRESREVVPRCSTGRPRLRDLAVKPARVVPPRTNQPRQHLMIGFDGPHVQGDRFRQSR